MEEDEEDNGEEDNNDSENTSNVNDSVDKDLCEGQSLSKHQEKNVLFKKCLYCLSVDY